MFKDYFVRVTANLLLKEHKFLIKNQYNPELYLTSSDLKKIQSKGLKELKSVLQGFNSNTIHAPFFDISPGGFDREIRELSFNKIDMVMDIAEDFGSELVVVHFNYYEVYYKEAFNKWLDNTSQFFFRLLKKDRKSYIALENISEDTPRIVLRLMKKINHKKIIHCFDVGHFNVFSKISPKEWLTALMPVEKIHFHFHDNLGNFDSHLPIGEGNINWKELKEIISESFKHFTITLECHNKNNLIQSIKNYKKIFLN